MYIEGTTEAVTTSLVSCMCVYTVLAHSVQRSAELLLLFIEGRENDRGQVSHDRLMKLLWSQE